MELANYDSQTRRSVSAWFASSMGPSSADDLARQAFESAKAHISDELPEKERKAIFGSQAASMQDFAFALSTARSRYESRKDSKAYIWLEKLSSRVVYYGNLLDILVQHHPEYVSLAWGTFKFLFISVLNHEEMVKNLAKSCANIAETLPRANLSLILYPTAAMREAVARLYATVMKFIANSVSWYRRSRLKHMLASITSPWSLDYQPALQEIEQHARNVDKLAQSGSQAELREAHLEIQQIRAELQATRGEIRVLATFVEDKFRRLIEFASMNQTLQLRISADVTSSKQMISHVQLGQILSLSFMKSLPTSGQCLAYCRSLRVRRREGLPADTGPSVSAMRKFNEQPGLNFLVVEDGSPIEVKDFLFDMIGVLRHLGLPVLWILRPRDLQRSCLTALDVIRMLFYQALEINGSALNTSHPITVAQLREASSHDDWLLLLKRALDGLSSVYIIMDSDVMEYITNRDKEIATRFLAEFVRVLGPETVRFIVSSRVFEAQQAKMGLGEDAVAGVRARRHMRHGNQTAKRRKGSVPRGRHHCQ